MFSNRPPCPDPDRFIWVKSTDGGHWRRKRGSIKKARLNAVLERNAALTKLSNDAGNRIMGKLHFYMDNMARGRFYSKLTGKLKKGYIASEKMNYQFLDGAELQPRYPLRRLLKEMYDLIVTEDKVEIQIPIYEHNLENTGGLVTHYFFELILLQGDASREYDLRIESDTSVVYSIGSKASDCVLSVCPSKKPWMVLLKLNCIETPTVNVMEMAASPSNYGMKVIAVR